MAKKADNLDPWILEATGGAGGSSPGLHGHETNPGIFSSLECRGQAAQTLWWRDSAAGAMETADAVRAPRPCFALARQGFATCLSTIRSGFC